MFQDQFRKRQLQQLSQIQVASPCSADWDEMEGDEKVRFCGECRRHVFNLSAMDVEEAGARIVEHTDGLCVRFCRRADGTILTRDCPIGVVRKRNARREALRSIAVFTFGGLFTTAMLMPTQGAVARPAARKSAKYSAIKSDDLRGLASLLNSDHDLEAASADGTTLLMRAAKVGNLEATRLLLACGANVQAADNQGRAPLAIALEEKHWKVASLLKEAGASR